VAGVNRVGERIGFAASMLIHVMVILTLTQWRASRPIEPPADDQGPPPEPIARIRMPPREVLQPPGRTPARPVAPAPRPTPRPEGKDRISIGGPAPVRQRTPLVLRRDEDLTRNVARGRPDAPERTSRPAPGPAPRPEPTRAEAAPSQTAPAAMPTPLVADGPADLPLAPPRPPGPSRPGAASSQPAGPSIADSLRQFEDRAAGADVRGLASGTGQQMGPLFFDPKGADFTAWANHFKNEVYRNWIVPPSVSMGIRGHVEIEFVVERDGTMSGLRLVRGSGTPSLDRAARNALLGSRLLPLPSDYAPAEVAMMVTFFYNETGP
jgi:TonB family protein